MKLKEELTMVKTVVFVNFTLVDYMIGGGHWTVWHNKNITITCKKSDERMHCRLINIFTTIKKIPT